MKEAIGTKIKYHKDGSKILSRGYRFVKEGEIFEFEDLCMHEGNVWNKTDRIFGSKCCIKKTFIRKIKCKLYGFWHLIKNYKYQKKSQYPNSSKYYFNFFDGYSDDEFGIDIKPNEVAGNIRLHHLGIIDIKVKEHWRFLKVTVTITLSRPELLIGKQGTTIGALERELIDRLGMSTKILIIEKSIW